MQCACSADQADVRNWTLARLSVIILAFAPVWASPAWASNEAEEKAAALWAIPEVQKAITFEGKDPSLLSLLGDLSRIQEIHIIDFSSYVGDSLIFSFPMMSAF